MTSGIHLFLAEAADAVALPCLPYVKVERLPGHVNALAERLMR